MNKCFKKVLTGVAFLCAISLTSCFTKEVITSTTNNVIPTTTEPTKTVAQTTTNPGTTSTTTEPTVVTTTVEPRTTTTTDIPTTTDPVVTTTTVEPIVTTTTDPVTTTTEPSYEVSLNDYKEFVSANDQVMDVEGFIFRKAGYINNYREGNLFIETNSGGLYALTASIAGIDNKDDFDKIPLGTYVKIKNATSTIYEGWPEIKQGTLVELTNRVNPDINAYLDNYNVLTSIINKNDYKYNENKLAEFKNLELKEVKEFDSTRLAANSRHRIQMIATFDYDGTEVSLGIHSGILPFESSLAINTYSKLKTLKKGDLITLRGIAVAHGGPQILAIDENAIKVTGHRELTEKEQAEEKLEEATKLFKSLYEENTEVVLSEGVYGLVRHGESARTIDNVIYIKPTKTLEEVTATLTVLYDEGNKWIEKNITFNTKLNSISTDIIPANAEKAEIKPIKVKNGVFAKNGDSLEEYLQFPEDVISSGYVTKKSNNRDGDAYFKTTEFRIYPGAELTFDTYAGVKIYKVELTASGSYNINIADNKFSFTISNSGNKTLTITKCVITYAVD